MESSTFIRPEKGDELDLRIDTLAYGGNGVARTRRLCRLRRRRDPRRPRPRGRHQAQARATARRARSRSSSRAPDRIAPLADHPGAPWQVLPYERQLEIKAEQVEDALRRIGQLDGFELRADRARRRAVALPQQARVLVRHGRRRHADLRLPRARLVGGHRRASTTACWQSERGNAAREQVLAWCREQGLAAYDRRTQHGAAAQPRRSARAAAPARCRCGSSPARRDRRHEPRAAPSTCDGAALDDDRCARRDDAGRRDRAARGRPRRSRRSSAACASRSRRSVLPDEHRDGRAALRGSPASSPGLQGWERVYDLFCGIGTIGLTLARARRRGLGPGDRRGRDRRRDRQRQAQRASPTRSSSPATSGSRCASSSTRPAGPTSSSSTRRARACRRRSCGASSRPRRKRIVYVSCNPTTLAPNAAQLVEAGYALQPRRAGRHVPADAAHRVRRAARARVAPGQP